MSKSRTLNSVFISYADRDKSRVRKVIGELKLRGVLSERDKVIDAKGLLVPGSNARDQVQKAIEDASKVIVIWSGAGAESAWVNYEAGMAEALGKPIFVVLGKGERSGLPIDLSDTQVIELEDVH
jgi:hypothetical protein